MINWAQLISLANRAKELGCNAIANIVIAMAIYEVADEFDSSVTVEWETADPVGRSLREPHYDLLVVAVGGEGVESQRLCIPAPMLSRSAAVTCIKRATIVPRRVHTRERRDPWAPWPDFSPFWAELGLLLNRDTARVAVENCLDSDTAVKTLAEIARQWHTLAERRRAMLAAAFPFFDEAVEEGVVSVTDDGWVHIALAREGKGAWADISSVGRVDADCEIGTRNLHLSELEHWISVIVGEEKAAEAVRNLRS